MYQQSFSLSARELADFLACDDDAISRLSMCRVPDPNDVEFGDNVQRIADFVPCNADHLVQILRVGDAVRRISNKQHIDGQNSC